MMELQLRCNMQNDLQKLHANIVIGDSRKMNELHDQGIDLVITSPPILAYKRLWLTRTNWVWTILT